MHLRVFSHLPCLVRLNRTLERLPSWCSSFGEVWTHQSHLGEDQNNRIETSLKRWSQYGSKQTLVQFVCGENMIHHASVLNPEFPMDTCPLHYGSDMVFALPSDNPNWLCLPRHSTIDSWPRSSCDNHMITHDCSDMRHKNNNRKCSRPKD